MNDTVFGNLVFVQQLKNQRRFSHYFVKAAFLLIFARWLSNEESESDLYSSEHHSVSRIQNGQVIHTQESNQVSEKKSK